MPPAAPATASTVCVSFVVAVTLIPESCVVSSLRTTGGRLPLPSAWSSISAIVSIPETETAIPAPTPAFSDFAAPLALALVSSLTVLEAVTSSGPPVSVTFAVSLTTALVSIVSTDTAMAPPMPIWPAENPARASVLFVVMPAAVTFSPADSIWAFSTMA